MSAHVRLVWRHFPLEGVHPHDDALPENQAHLKTSHLRGYAGRPELDPQRYDADMERQACLGRVRERVGRILER